MATAAMKAGGSELIINSPGSKGTRVYLERERYRLGRSTSNELCFPDDDRLSREHLVFELRDGAWTVRDTGSRNGTRVNGTVVGEPVRLASGDQITAGRLAIRYAEGALKQQDGIVFVDETPTDSSSGAAVSVDLKSALKAGVQTSSRAGLEHRQLEALVRAGRELAGHCELEKLFELILGLSLDAVKASRGVVMTLESDGGLKSRAIRGQTFTISTTVRDRVLQQRESLLVRDASLEAAFAARESIMAQKIRSFLAVPLQTDERVTGLIYLDSPHVIREFSIEDLNLLTVMANIAAIRIEHARLVEVEEARRMLARELERAAEIQRRLLPSKAPDIGGLQLAGYNAPCQTVGGDYFDFLPFGDGRVALLVGDVSGKGMGAALLMSGLQARVQALFQEPGELAAQVGRLNRSICASCPEYCFVTFFIAVADPATGNIEYCNAGHNPPIVLHRTTNEIETLGATGTVLGFFPDYVYQRGTCHLSEGDLLLLYSDGVTEARASGGGEEFGETRLAEFVQQQRDATAESLIAAINKELLSFTGGAAAADDVTLVAAKRVTPLTM